MALREFDAKARIETALRQDGPRLTVVRASLFMESWLPALGSRLALRGNQQATLERGFWLTRVTGATTQRSLDRFGIALLPGKGNARHAFIDVDDVADALTAAALDQGELGEELRLGGPEVLSWREVATIYGRVLARPIRVVQQPTEPFHALSAATRTISPAASHLLAVQHLIPTVDTAYPPDDAQRLLGRDPTSVEAFLQQRVVTR